MILKLNPTGLRGFVWGFCLAVLGLFFLTTFLVNTLLKTLVGTSSSTTPASPVAPASPASPAVSPAPNTSTTPNPNSTPNPAVESPPSPSDPSSETPLVPQSYQTKFTRLNPEPIRQTPSADGAEIGQVEFNQEITVLEESPDGLWRKIRADNIEGWVRTDRLQ
ncbi:SH3 domain-containing protein [Leptolyngbya sp. NK1-12]|uniref:SH3 domain-containing protein n=1 Tax=Leptolyngbya sp. NK1-12 TaxID=2547451 RepID=A0AA96WJM4_9CYAN|nr:SH3 domain-containing protein [Leptolyngbya sp. NK1-12]